MYNEDIKRLEEIKKRIKGGWRLSSDLEWLIFQVEEFLLGRTIVDFTVPLKEEK